MKNSLLRPKKIEKQIITLSGDNGDGETGRPKNSTCFIVYVCLIFNQSIQINEILINVS